jgi:2-oxoglutarate ferredoxin oxidoreductase subunit alpha
MANERKVLMCGNEVIGEAAIQAGCRHYFGYPITPQNELPAYMARRMEEVGGVFLQSESELAAVNMALGVAACGGRVMTSSSSPGISLKQEGLSYLAALELPVVVINVCRGGPGLGNIAPAQSDYFQAVKGGGHGDYHVIVLAPFNHQELYDLTALAFDLADKYRNPALILADGVLGQMMEPVVLKKIKPKIFKKDWALTGARGLRGRAIYSLFLEEGKLEKHNEKLQEKYRVIKKNEVRFEAYNIDRARVVAVAYGSSARLVKAAVKMAEAEGIKAGYIRPITLWPFPGDIFARAKDKRYLVVEMSAGQMLEDVERFVGDRSRVSFYGRTGGGIPQVEEIVRNLRILAG